jgi:hypothetical protein
MNRIDKSVISAGFDTSYWRLDGGIAAGAKNLSLKHLNSSSKSSDEFIARTLPIDGEAERTRVVHLGLTPAPIGPGTALSM